MMMMVYVQIIESLRCAVLCICMIDTLNARAGSLSLMNSKWMVVGFARRNGAHTWRHIIAVCQSHTAAAAAAALRAIGCSLGSRR